jgi:hypothetical protein
MGKGNRPARSPEVLARALGHVRYEIEQLLWTLWLYRRIRLLAAPFEPVGMTVPLLNARLLHLRNLIHFFSVGGRVFEDDVFSSDFGFDRAPFDLPQDYRDQINAHLAHLTYRRSQPDWRDAVPEQVLARAAVFSEHVCARCRYLPDSERKAWLQLREKIAAVAADTAD